MVKLLSIFMILFLFSLSIAETAHNQVEIPIGISSFSGTDTAYSKSFAVGDYEGLSLVIMVPRTVTAKFTINYERNYRFNGGMSPDYPAANIDTFNTTAAGNFYRPGSTVENNHQDTNVVGALDSISYPGYTKMIIPFIPYRSPDARIEIIGLAGNSATAYKVYMWAILTRWTRTG